MDYIPDALDLFYSHDRRQQAELDKRPKCSICDEPIQEDRCYRFDGELICEECVENNFRVFTEDFIE